MFSLTLILGTNYKAKPNPWKQLVVTSLYHLDRVKDKWSET